MNVDLTAGLWRFHQVIESQPSYQQFLAPQETGGSTTILFYFKRRTTPVPDRRFGADGDWYDAIATKPGWRHSDPGVFWLQLFAPPKAAPGGWMMQIVQTAFAPADLRDKRHLTLWVGELTDHPDWGFKRVRFFGHGRRNSDHPNWDQGSGGRLSFTLTQQGPEDPPAVMVGYPPGWQENK